MLANKIKKDFITAFKNKEMEKKNLLGLVKWEILLIEKEREVTDWDVIKIIKKLLKWINESLKTKEDKALIKEKEILESYLPKELSKEEIKEIITKLEDNKNIWLVMKYFKDNYEWRIDNRLVMECIKEL